jgi:aspartyl-tRNA(Asn)/glutamyl-tRNA(Gln) amidotransferase subunit C
MKIDDKLLDKLQNLSYLRVDSDKKSQMKESLSEIVNYMDKLSAVEFDKNSSIEKKQKETLLSEDIVEHSDVAKSVLDGSTNQKDNFFVVPKIIE